jgi:PD-(D/E)XK endonuclease
MTMSKDFIANNSLQKRLVTDALQTGRGGFHTGKMGEVVEGLVMLNLATRFKDCIVSDVTNNQPHDVEIRRKDEKFVEGICKIQVKSTTTRSRKVDSYHVNFARGTDKRAMYAPDDADFFLVYVFPESTFYVIPQEAAAGIYGTRLYVGCKKPIHASAGKCERYVEAWHLIGDFLKIQDDATRTEGTLLASCA